MISFIDLYSKVRKNFPEVQTLYGADCRGCMTPDLYEKVIGMTMNFHKKKALRSECACFMGNDIGAYNTCPHLCRYCYANYDERTVRDNYKNHDKTSPFLIGGSLPGDVIHDAEQKINAKYQNRVEKYTVFIHNKNIKINER